MIGNRILFDYRIKFVIKILVLYKKKLDVIEVFLINLYINIYRYILFRNIIVIKLCRFC